jgi:hypothetical protein
MQTPDMIGQSSLHCRRHSQSHVHAAEIVPSHKQRHCRFQVGYGFAGRIRLAREASQVHSDGEIGSFDVGSRDAREVRHPRLNSRYGCDDCAAAVPFWASLRAPVDLLQLCEVDVRSVPLFDCAHIATQGVRGDLEAANGALAEIMHEVISVNGVSSANVVRENHLAVAVKRQPRPLVAPSGGRFRRDALAVASHVAPQFIKLHELRMNVANLAIEYALCVFSSGVHQRQDRLDMQASQPRDGANAGFFQHHRESTNGGVRVGVVFAQFGNISGECSTAGSTAVALNLAFPVEAKTLYGIMLATFAGHIGLVFLAGQADNCFEVGIAAYPACRLALSLVRANGGALIRDGRDPIWTGISRFGGPVLCQLSYAPTGGIRGFAPKNALRLFSYWWVSHSISPFAWIERLKSLRDHGKQSLGNLLCSVHALICHPVFLPAMLAGDDDASLVGDLSDYTMVVLQVSNADKFVAERLSCVLRLPNRKGCR